MNQSSRKPTSKVAAGGVAGAFSILLVWALEQGGLQVPAEVASALTTVVSFGAAYLKKSGV